MNINDSVKYMRVTLPEDILRRKMFGDFDGAIRLIDRRLAESNLPDALRGSLEEVLGAMSSTPGVIRCEILAG